MHNYKAECRVHMNSPTVPSLSFARYAFSLAQVQVPLAMHSALTLAKMARLAIVERN